MLLLQKAEEEKDVASYVTFCVDVVVSVVRFACVNCSCWLREDEPRTSSYLCGLSCCKHSSYVPWPWYSCIITV